MLMEVYLSGRPSMSPTDIEYLKKKKNEKI